MFRAGRRARIQLLPRLLAGRRYADRACGQRAHRVLLVTDQPPGDERRPVQGVYLPDDLRHQPRDQLYEVRVARRAQLFYVVLSLPLFLIVTKCNSHAARFALFIVASYLIECFFLKVGSNYNIFAALIAIFTYF